jgi:DNA-binding response OmpR family regulator
MLSYLPTLVVDSNPVKARLLAECLDEAGFPADFAASCAEAWSAVRNRHYGSMVYIGDLEDQDDFKCLVKLRGRARGTWIILIHPGGPPEAQERALRHGVDALLKAPYSLQELLARLLAFSMRSRGHVT